ncbi:excalibur calcium-binding domain-containing protein [Actinopolymorpha alba]|uniref:excalibur calcium-binding domain-containing protein n=1 Tax=Actinopolymorpha alba TaxID=533267 RepID=UPI0003A971BF|nr:excalibur calcium-binding domain-containing protein [Actinopolymorpha alba]
MPARFNPPPNWPEPPAGWTPPSNWEPDPSWGPPPYGWTLWIDDAPSKAPIVRRRLAVGLGFVAGISAILIYVNAFSAPPDEMTIVTSDPDVSTVPGTSRPGPKSGAGSSDSVPQQDPAPYTASPSPTPTTSSGSSDASGAPRPRPPARSTTPSSTPDNGDHTRDRGDGRDRDRDREYPRPRWPREGDLDPRYRTCAQVRAHGYGPYYIGKDPEYFWYPDRNRDGVVCD